MIPEEMIRKQIAYTLKETRFGIGSYYKGKVRDNYSLNGKRIVVTTDRISAFDVVLGTVPFKGQVLNQLAVWWFEQTGEVPNHLIESPDQNVMIVKNCKPVPIEMVVRGYLTGSAWRAYEKGDDVSGIRLPKGLKKNQKFDEPIITPTTKTDEGHDLPITREYIVKNILPEKEYGKIEQMSLELFRKGSELARKRGLILVDTKYEYGRFGNDFLVIDEIHTPDSSRFWVAESYDRLFREGSEQQMLDKEYIRQWLIARGFMGNGPAPELTEEVLVEAARRYIELYELITGRKFEAEPGSVEERVRQSLQQRGYLK